MITLTASIVSFVAWLWLLLYLRKIEREIDEIRKDLSKQIIAQQDRLIQQIRRHEH